ncbi:hypothetical protein [Neisseria meningitidis]|uniref:hypothetical protein n=1 Tax=Neisseria meningitidis TaxID=487 RepID=UPI0011873500|nr:hypothetical protein [Neisseria meningitidis]
MPSEPDWIQTAFCMAGLADAKPAPAAGYRNKFKSQGDEAADSTNSTEPDSLVLQHFREAFSLS